MPEPPAGTSVRQRLYNPGLMLKHWQAMRFGRVLENGRTKPMVLECEEIGEATFLDSGVLKAPSRSEFVVKALGNPEVDESYIERELLGNLLARQYGLQTPEPAVVRISQAFVEAVNPILTKHGYQIRPGNAAGCEFFRDGFASPPAEALWTSEELAEFALLYGFDLAVQNPDRVVSRPNCAMKGSHLIAFDFDMCFSFLHLIGMQQLPWEVSKHGIASTHLCQNRLLSRKGSFTWQENKNSVRQLTDEVLLDVTSGVSEAWAGCATRVRSHISAIRSHVDQFELELEGSLI